MASGCKSTMGKTRSRSCICGRRLLWSNDLLRVDCSNSLSAAPRLSPRSLENLKNVKGVTWPHGPSMESPCLEAEAKNHSSPSLRLLLKRFWNRLSYLRSTHLSGTPSNTTNVLLMRGESYKPIRRTCSARNGTARLSLASEKQSGTRARAASLRRPILVQSLALRR